MKTKPTETPAERFRRAINADPDVTAARDRLWGMAESHPEYKAAIKAVEIAETAVYHRLNAK